MGARIAGRFEFSSSEIPHISYGSPSSSSSSIKGDSQRDFFVELWDIAGHERYKECRTLFYTQINGVIFVHDLCQRKTKTNMLKWASEIASVGTRVSSGNLVDVARQWVEKQGLLSSTEEIPLTESFPGGSSLLAAAKEARFDKEALIKFFGLLIRRRYFSDELPAANPWSPSPQQNLIHRSTESSDDQYQKRLSFSTESYEYNATSPVPAQLNLTPSPTLYPQQPISVSENYSFQRLPLSGLSEIASTKSRANINV